MKIFAPRAALLCAALTLTLAALCAPAPAQTPPAYATIVDLGTLSGQYSYGYGVSENGNVTGRATLAGDAYYHAFLYTGGHIIDLGTLGGTNSYGYAVNDNGAVTGYSERAGGQRRAFVYRQGTLTPINPFNGDYSYGYGINNNGTIAGTAGYPQNSGGSAFLLTLSGVRKLSGAFAYSINNYGVAVGDAVFGSPGYDHAVRYEKGQVIDLGTLGGIASDAYAISQNGKVTGDALTLNNKSTHAFLYEAGHMTDLGTTARYSEGYGVNDIGQVVGNNQDRYGNTTAFLWQDGKMIPLGKALPPNSGWTLLTARGITNSGYVTGYGIHLGHGHAYLLQLPAGFAP